MRYGSLSTDRLPSWAILNQVGLSNAEVVTNILDHEGNSKGGGLVAKQDASAGDILLKIPAELIVSQSQVDQCSKGDTYLQTLMHSVAEFAKTPRLRILVFLVYQMTMTSPDAEDTARNKQSPHADYMRFLPKNIPLPTFYTESERALLIGTSLAHALEQKLISLEREFEQIREITLQLPWFRDVWWDEAHGILTFEDWKLADAMYRSRALELPHGVGDSMVPVVDMANHASDNRSNARFEVDQAGNALLLVRDDKLIASGEEITIMYGVGGACEMIFSYGFLEEGASSAREMFLGISIPEDDPLRLAKIRYAEEAPGVRIYVDEQGIAQWDSGYLWWACVNEEDGLDFRVMQTVDGQKELKGLWKEQDFEAHQLKDILMADTLRDVFVLRATVLVQQRLEVQGMQLASTEVAFTVAREELQDNAGEMLGTLVARLRDLELELVSAGFLQLETEKDKLMESSTVRSYLQLEGQEQTTTGEQDDFS